MFRFLKTRHNLRNEKLFSFSRRYYTDENGVKHPATGKLAIVHLRFHQFHRMDDKDFHNHIFEFWTFPFVSYKEEYLLDNGDGTWTPKIRWIKAWQWTYKNATEPHRILGPVNKDGCFIPGKIRTVIWRGFVNKPGSTGFYMPTDREGYYDFLTFEQYVKLQKEIDAQKGK